MTVLKLVQLSPLPLETRDGPSRPWVDPGHPFLSGSVVFSSSKSFQNTVRSCSIEFSSTLNLMCGSFAIYMCNWTFGICNISEYWQFGAELRKRLQVSGKDLSKDRAQMIRKSARGKSC